MRTEEIIKLVPQTLWVFFAAWFLEKMDNELDVSLKLTLLLDLEAPCCDAIDRSADNDKPDESLNREPSRQ